MSKEMSAEDRAFAYLEETNYAAIHRGANWLGRQVGKVKGLNKRLKGQRQAVADTFKSGKQDGDNVSPNQVAMKEAMKSNSSKFDTVKKRSAAVLAGKKGALHRIAGGTAGGAVLGGAAGVGIGHLASGSSRKRAAYLKSKGDSMSNKERAELVHHEGKIKKAKVIGGVVGTLAGAGAGYLAGKGAARKNKLKLFKAYNKSKTSAMNQHNKATKDKDGKGVLDKIADRVKARNAK